jgi:hypothetical protein
MEALLRFVMAQGRGEGGRQKGEGRREKAKGRRQKAKGVRNMNLKPETLPSSQDYKTFLLSV